MPAGLSLNDVTQWKEVLYNSECGHGAGGIWRGVGQRKRLEGEQG